MSVLLSAEQALGRVLSNEGHFRESSTSFICPHCTAFAQQKWGKVGQLSIPMGGDAQAWRKVQSRDFVLAACQACGAESLFVGFRLVHPAVITAPGAHPDLPPELAADFEEARQISSLSPRGAAALLRLTLQKLCPLIGATEAPIDKMIGQLVREGKIPAAVQQAMDSVRVWGNEAVHPGVLDLRDDPEMVIRLFKLVNLIVEKAITEPRQIAEIYGALPAGKLAGIAQRDGK